MGPLGMFAAEQAISGGMGMMLSSINDSRQVRQQRRLQDLQIEGQQRMTDYNMRKQLEMWKATSYPAQLEMMKKAGINPALMYGQGGGGGTTVGSATGNVTGGQAPAGGREIQDMMGMGMQLQLMNAQKRVLETQAEKNEAEALKTKGVDTQESVQRMEESKTRIDALLQGIDNAKQQNTIQKLEITLKNMENFERQASQEDRLDYIEYQTKIAAKQLKLLTNEGTISDATMNDKIKIVAHNAINAALQNINLQATTRKTEQEISNIAQNIMMNWDYLHNDNQRLEIQKQLKDWETDPNREAIRQALQIIPSIMGQLPQTTRTSTGSTREGNTTTTRTTTQRY